MRISDWSSDVCSSDLGSRMFGVLAKRLFGSANDRYLKGLTSSVAAINALEPKLQELSDEALRGRTAELRGRLAQGESLDDVLPDAFATVREAAKRTLGQRHYDVQLIGGMVLHQGKNAEDRKSVVEGKGVVVRGATGCSSEIKKK